MIKFSQEFIVVVYYLSEVRKGGMNLPFFELPRLNDKKKLPSTSDFFLPQWHTDYSAILASAAHTVQQEVIWTFIFLVCTVPQMKELIL